MNTRIGNYPIHKRITYPRATQPRIPPSPQAHRASTEGHPAHRCAQTVDHLDQKQPKTPISSEVDCALGQGHNTTNNNQRPSKHPVHKTRPGHCGELHAKFGEVAQRNLRYRRYRRYLREDANTVVARSPVARSHSGAQNADHLCSNHQNTAIVAEMVCTLDKLPTRTILTSTQRLPTPPRRPRARTRIGYEHADR